MSSSGCSQTCFGCLVGSGIALSCGIVGISCIWYFTGGTQLNTKRLAVSQQDLSAFDDPQRIASYALGTKLVSTEEERTTVFVQWKIADNVTQGLIRRGAKTDIRDVLKAFSESRADYHELVMTGIFPLANEFGEQSYGNVVIATYTRDAVNRIRWDSFLTDDVYQIARDDVYLHPEFRD